jgi:hypothetical protein
VTRTEGGGDSDGGRQDSDIRELLEDPDVAAVVARLSARPEVRGWALGEGGCLGPRPTLGRTWLSVRLGRLLLPSPPSPAVAVCRSAYPPPPQPYDADRAGRRRRLGCLAGIGRRAAEDSD